MKTMLLVSIIAAIGISLTALVFIYQYQQNCRVEGGSLVEPLTCDKTNYELIMDKFREKYAPERGSVMDGTSGAIIEMIAIDSHGDSITLIIKENQNGSYYAEIICKHKDSGRTKIITENMLGYLQNENCFSTFAESDIEYFPITDPCTLSCKERLESMNYTCTELEAKSYECRDEIKPIHEELIYTYVIPPELGEYYLIPPDVEQWLDSIIMVSFYADDSVRLTFDDEFNVDSITIGKSQKFTSFCFESKNLRVWTFTDIVEVSDKQYIEMHNRLAKIPEGFDCSNPIHILEKS